MRGKIKDYWTDDDRSLGDKTKAEGVPFGQKPKECGQAKCEG